MERRDRKERWWRRGVKGRKPSYLTPRHGRKERKNKSEWYSRTKSGTRCKEKKNKRREDTRTDRRAHFLLFPSGVPIPSECCWSCSLSTLASACDNPNELLLPI